MGKMPYKYVMDVTETVKSTYTVRSARKLTAEELEARTERARVEGRLKLSGVTDVEIYCSDASKDGVSHSVLRERLLA